ncbi:cupin domain-containing protein [Gemmobacter lanyuensis]
MQRMPGPHMHSQVELNFVLDGAMTYWFDGRELTVDAGRLCLFWGMVPHQVIDRQDPTRFICLYVPMSVFLGLPALSRFRDAVFRGAVIEATDLRAWDRDIFLRWREELLSGDPALTEIVRNELTARVLRIQHEGWRDLRADASAIPRLRRMMPRASIMSNECCASLPNGRMNRSRPRMSPPPPRCIRTTQ